MNVRSKWAACLLSLTVVSCGSSSPAAEPTGSSNATPATSDSTTEAPTGAPLSAQIAGTWYPVAVDGVALDAAQRDRWSFEGTDTSLHISGYDGCNRFNTDGDSDPALIVGGRLGNVVIGSEAQDCGDDVHGPYPETGAMLTVSNDGASLTFDGPSGIVELSRAVPEQESEPADEALAEQLEGRWQPVSVDAVAVDAADGDFWSFSGTATDLEIIGFDGCNNFNTIVGPNQETTTIVDGRLAYLDFASEDGGCEDGVVSGPYPDAGALLTVSDDGETLMVDGYSGIVVLSRTSAAPAVLSDDPPPASDPGIGTFDLSPAKPEPGETFEATFDADNERGGYFTLEQWSGSEWLPAVFLLESDADTRPASWSSIEDGVETLDYGIGGTGPDGLVMPDHVAAGVWRLCTANARDETCARLTIDP